MPNLIPFTAAHQSNTIAIWNAAAHPDYPINERFLAFNTTPCTGESIEGRLALREGQPAGFVLTCAVKDNSLGWISALAVHPNFQRGGFGSELLAWAEDWLKNESCTRVRIGGSLHPFAPGLPYAMSAGLPFFEKHSYSSPAHQPCEYDIARSLKDYRSIYPQPDDATLMPMQSGEEPQLLEFLGREYPGRWEFEAREFVKGGGRASDYLLLRVSGEVHGFCRLTLADSERPIERFYPQRLPRPWGQFGPLGLSKTMRGRGLGGFLIDGAAAHLQSLGVDGCVIDWTSLVDLYGKFGFTEYNRYITLFKDLIL